MPPQVAPAVARLIRIEDIDRGVKSWFEDVLDATVMSPQGDRQKVTVKFASGERWVASADRQGIRDRDGRLILPVIQIRRTGIDFSHNMLAFGTNVPRLNVSTIVAEKTSDLANLDENRPISQRRLRDSAVYDVYSVPSPRNQNFLYKVRIQAQYQTHINEIVEKIFAKIEFFSVPSFVISLANVVREVGIKTGDGSTELDPLSHSKFSERPPLNDYYVVGYIGETITDEGNLDEFTDEERILQLQFTFTVPTVMLLDPDGMRPSVQRERTAFGITMLGEEVHVTENRAESDKIFGK